MKNEIAHFKTPMEYVCPLSNLTKNVQSPEEIWKTFAYPTETLTHESVYEKTTKVNTHG